MTSANPTARDLRRMNRHTVFRHLYLNAPISRLELSQISGLSAGTIANVISELLAENLVLEAGFEASEGGRPRAILTLNMDYGYFIGGEIGETEVMVELFDIQLTKIRAVKYALQPEENNPQTIVERFIQHVEDILAEEQIARDKILGIGIGVPGIVELAKEETVSAPAWGWVPVPLKTLLEKHFSLPLYVDNGSKLMALAEVQKDPEAHHETMAVLNLGTGVGAGIIYEGKLYRGGNNSAGEWGHTTMVLDGDQCRCGCRGCLEAYVGAPGIIRRLRAVAPRSLTSLSDEAELVEALIQTARQGDETLARVLADTLHYLGAGIANLINLFNPQRIILGGKVGLLLGAYCLPELTQEVERYALKQPFHTTRLLVSQLGADAVSLGAARQALEAFMMQVGMPGDYASQSAVSRLALPARKKLIKK
ncbi:MAG TPA: ROK family protein [Ktedonobacteraceae bacterium]